MLKLLIWYIIATGAIKVVLMYMLLSVAAQLSFVFWFCSSVWLVAFLDIWISRVSLKDSSDEVEDTGWYYHMMAAANLFIVKFGLVPGLRLVQILFPQKLRWLLKSAIMMYLMIDLALSWMETIDVDGLGYRYKIVYLYTPIYLVLMVSFVDSLMVKYASKKHRNYIKSLEYRDLDPTFASEEQLEVMDKFMSKNLKYLKYHDAEERKRKWRNKYRKSGLPLPHYAKAMIVARDVKHAEDVREGIDHVSRIARKKPWEMTKR
jgi:hypothetical protein